jgi:hypothetical protein
MLLTLVGLIKVFLNNVEAICLAEGVFASLSNSNTSVVKNLF